MSSKAAGQSGHAPARTTEEILVCKKNVGHVRLSPSEFRSLFEHVSALWEEAPSFDWSFFMRLSRTSSSILSDTKITAADTSLLLFFKYIENNSPVCALISEDNVKVFTELLRQYLSLLDIDVVDGRRMLTMHKMPGCVGVLTPQLWADVVLPSLLHPGESFSRRYNPPYVVIPDPAILQKTKTSSIPVYFYEQHRGVDSSEQLWLKSLANAWMSKSPAETTDDAETMRRIDLFLDGFVQKKTENAVRFAKAALWNLELIRQAQQMEPALCSLSRSGRFDINIPKEWRNRLPESAVHGFMSTLFYADKSTAAEKVFGQMDVMSVDLLNLLDLFSSGVAWLGMSAGSHVWVPKRLQFERVRYKNTHTHKQRAHVSVSVFPSQDSFSHNLQKSASNGALILSTSEQENSIGEYAAPFMQAWLRNERSQWSGKEVVLLGFPLGLSEKMLAEGFPGAIRVSVFVEKHVACRSMSADMYEKFNMNLVMSSLGGLKATLATRALFGMMASPVVETEHLKSEIDLLNSLIVASANAENQLTRKAEVSRAYQSFSAERAFSGLKRPAESAFGMQLFF